MPKIIAFVAWKGGVGKTHTSINLAGAFAALGYKVALIDNDAQSNLTYEFGMSKEAETIVDVYRGTLKTLPLYQYGPERLAYEVKKDVAELMRNIYVCPSNQSLEDVTTYLIREGGFAIYQLMKDAINNTPLIKEMDYVIIDNPPNIKSPVVTNSILCCDDVIIPVDSEGFSSLQNLADVYMEINSAIVNNPNLHIMGALQTRFENDSTGAEVLRQADKFLTKTNNTLLKTKIRFLKTNKISRIVHLPVCLGSPNQPAAEDHFNLAAEVEDYYKKIEKLSRRSKSLK